MPASAKTSIDNDAWPGLTYADWQDSCNTLHLWTQIVGKVKLALSPVTNHWWSVVLYVNARYDAAANKGGWDRKALERR